MTVTIIAAIGLNGELGKDNDLIWHLPDDMAFFKNSTKGHHIVTGRKNYESIPHKFRPLPGRTNIVVTRKKDYSAPGSVVVNSLSEALKFARQNDEHETFIIGGGQIYSAALEEKLVDKMYLTHVDGSFEADVFFPEFDIEEWNKEVIENHDRDEKHDHEFSIALYTRK